MLPIKKYNTRVSKIVILVGVYFVLLSNSFIYANTNHPNNKITDQAIFSEDTRRIISRPQKNPNYSPIGCITSVFPDGTESKGTGFLISEMIIATAANVVYSQAHGGYATTKSTFIPSAGSVKEGGVESPFGKANFSSIKVPDKYRDPREQYTENYDYALVYLDKILGEDKTANYFNLRKVSLVDFLSKDITISGYPNEAHGNRTASMWTDTGIAIAKINDTRIAYQIPTSPGQNGSPIVLAADPRIVIGIHTDGRLRNPLRLNNGVFTAKEMYDFLTTK